MDGLTACPNCREPEPQVFGTRTSRHDRGDYARWTTTTARYGCASCGAVTTMTVRVPAVPPTGPGPTVPATGW